MTNEPVATPLSPEERPTSYKLIKQVVNTVSESRDCQRDLVKLSKTRIFRNFKDGKYVEVDYVLVGRQRITVQDGDGSFVYEETQIIASEEDGTEHHAYAYFVTRKLSLEEALFAIGEV